MTEISNQTIEAKLNELKVTDVQARREVHAVVSLYKNRVGQNIRSNVFNAFSPDTPDLESCREAAMNLLSL